MALLRRLLGPGSPPAGGRSGTFGLSHRERMHSRDSFRETFGPYRYRQLELSTPGGTIEGTVVDIEDHCLIVREAGDTFVLVPYANILSFKPTPLP